MKRLLPKRWIVWLVILLALLGMIGSVSAYALRNGECAPRMKLADLKGGNATIPDMLRGKVAIVHFWTSGCSSCKEEIPAMERLYREYGSKGLVIVAVNVGQEPATVKTAVAELGMSYPVLLDTERKSTALYDVVGVPRTIILDRNGTVRFKIVGTAPAPTLRKCIQSLL